MCNWVCDYCGEEFESPDSLTVYDYGGEKDLICFDCIDDYETGILKVELLGITDTDGETAHA